ncbi:MAG TPA: hypothetical protein PLV37_00385 [Bacillota bacterium]|jgi:hypothetical protein|nr:hypothetical protein [Bacillota bacterium]
MSTLDINPLQVNTCEGVAYQTSTVCVPVTVTPFAVTGTTTTFCCGMPVVAPDTNTCPGVLNGSCVFTITQDICTAVPVDFGATAVPGSPSVLCGTASAEDICTGCGAV